MNPVLMLLGLAYLTDKNKKKKSTPVIGGDTTAFLYTLPEDGFTTTRLAVSSGGDDPQEMGIFDSPARALAVAQAAGMTITHGGEVLKLKNKPGTASA